MMHRQFSQFCLLILMSMLVQTLSSIDSSKLYFRANLLNLSLANQEQLSTSTNLEDLSFGMREDMISYFNYSEAKSLRIGTKKTSNIIWSKDKISKRKAHMKKALFLYVGPYSGPYTGPYGGPYSGPYSGPYTGPYGGPYSGPYSGPYTGPYTPPYVPSPTLLPTLFPSSKPTLYPSSIPTFGPTFGAFDKYAQFQFGGIEHLSDLDATSVTDDKYNINGEAAISYNMIWKSNAHTYLDAGSGITLNNGNGSMAQHLRDKFSYLTLEDNAVYGLHINLHYKKSELACPLSGSNFLVIQYNVSYGWQEYMKVQQGNYQDISGSFVISTQYIHSRYWRVVLRTFCANVVISETESVSRMHVYRIDDVSSDQSIFTLGNSFYNWDSPQLTWKSMVGGGVGITVTENKIRLANAGKLFNLIETGVYVLDLKMKMVESIVSGSFANMVCTLSLANQVFDTPISFSKGGYSQTGLKEFDRSYMIQVNTNRSTTSSYTNSSFGVSITCQNDTFTFGTSWISNSSWASSAVYRIDKVGLTAYGLFDLSSNVYHKENQTLSWSKRFSSSSYLSIDVLSSVSKGGQYFQFNYDGVYNLYAKLNSDFIMSNSSKFCKLSLQYLNMSTNDWSTYQSSYYQPIYGFSDATELQASFLLSTQLVSSQIWRTQINCGNIKSKWSTSPNLSRLLVYQVSRPLPTLNPIPPTSSPTAPLVTQFFNSITSFDSSECGLILFLLIPLGLVVLMFFISLFQKRPDDSETVENIIYAIKNSSCNISRIVNAIFAYILEAILGEIDEPFESSEAAEYLANIDNKLFSIQDGFECRKILDAVRDQHSLMLDYIPNEFIQAGQFIKGLKGQWEKFIGDEDIYKKYTTEDKKYQTWTSYDTFVCNKRIVYVGIGDSNKIKIGSSHTDEAVTITVTDKFRLKLIGENCRWKDFFWGLLTRQRILNFLFATAHSTQSHIRTRRFYAFWMWKYLLLTQKFTLQMLITYALVVKLEPLPEYAVIIIFAIPITKFLDFVMGPILIGIALALYFILFLFAQLLKQLFRLEFRKFFHNLKMSVMKLFNYLVSPIAYLIHSAALLVYSILMFIWKKLLPWIWQKFPLLLVSLWHFIIRKKTDANDKVKDKEKDKEEDKEKDKKETEREVEINSLPDTSSASTIPDKARNSDSRTDVDKVLLVEKLSEPKESITSNQSEKEEETALTKKRFSDYELFKNVNEVFLEPVGLTTNEFDLLVDRIISLCLLTFLLLCASILIMYIMFQATFYAHLAGKSLPSFFTDVIFLDSIVDIFMIFLSYVPWFDDLTDFILLYCGYETGKMICDWFHYDLIKVISVIPGAWKYQRIHKQHLIRDNRQQYDDFVKYFKNLWGVEVFDLADIYQKAQSVAEVVSNHTGNIRSKAFPKAAAARVKGELPVAEIIQMPNNSEYDVYSDESADDVTFGYENPRYPTSPSSVN